MKRSFLKRRSARRQVREEEARPLRDQLRVEVNRCETCGWRPGTKHEWGPAFAELDVHEIARGALRQKALDKRFATLVVCRFCNQYALMNRSMWPEVRQLAILYQFRPQDYDLEAYNELVNPNAPSRITQQEVDAWLTG